MRIIRSTYTTTIQKQQQERQQQQQRLQRNTSAVKNNHTAIVLTIQTEIAKCDQSMQLCLDFDSVVDKDVNKSVDSTLLYDHVTSVL